MSHFFPQKLEELQTLLKVVQMCCWQPPVSPDVVPPPDEQTCDVFQTSFSCSDAASLRAPLDIPIPDPAKEEAKRKKKEEVWRLPPFWSSSQRTEARGVGGRGPGGQGPGGRGARGRGAGGPLSNSSCVFRVSGNTRRIGLPSLIS